MSAWINPNATLPGSAACRSNRVLIAVRTPSGKALRTIAEYIHAFTVRSDDFFEEGWSSGQCDIGEDGDEYVKPGWYESLLYSEQLLEIEDEVIGWMPIPEYQ